MLLFHLITGELVNTGTQCTLDYLCCNFILMTVLVPLLSIVFVDFFVASKCPVSLAVARLVFGLSNNTFSKQPLGLSADLLAINNGTYVTMLLADVH